METTVTVKGITYTFAPHAVERMIERHITVGMVKHVLTNPDRYEQSRSSDNILYIRAITGKPRPLLVAVDEANRIIWTVYWL